MKTKMYILDRQALKVWTDKVNLENDEEREKFYEDWTRHIEDWLFLTEQEFKVLEEHIQREQ